ncbi:MAG TPA: resolvase [Bacillota bacterium]|nr:resolvase [Bacillota bacterium]
MRFVIGVDPGSSKVGLALLDGEGRLIKRRIVARSEAASEIACLAANKHATIALGNGTTAKQLVSEIRAALKDGGSVDIVMVDEMNSTLEGRTNYLTDNKPKGLAALIPMGLRSPKRHWDDYVAEVIARRYLGCDELGEE